jgi:hypothetical protein
MYCQVGARGDSSSKNQSICNGILVNRINPRLNVVEQKTSAVIRHPAVVELMSADEIKHLDIIDQYGPCT